MKTVQTVAASSTLQQAAPDFDFSRQYLHQEQLYGLEGRPAAAAQPASKGDTKFGGAAEDDAPPHHGQQWVLLRFSQPIVAPAVRPRAAVAPQAVVASDQMPASLRVCCALITAAYCCGTSQEFFVLQQKAVTAATTA